MPEILITENIAGSPIDELKATHDVAFRPDLWRDRRELIGALRGVRALVVRNQTQVDGEVIDEADCLQIVARAGAGIDNVDVAAASRAGVVVAYTPSQNSLSVAELTLGLMLALARKIPAADRNVRQSKWARYQFVGSELHGKTLGVVGFGRIGRLTAQRAAAFGMNVLACSRHLDSLRASLAGTPVQPASLDELLATADVVTCHLPANGQTASMFDYDRFCRMKPTAVFINVARGEVVDEAGLVRALQEGRIAGAALDVRAQEPPQPGPLDTMDNVILTPHVGAFTHEGQHRVVASVCRDVEAVLAGKEAKNYVNFARPKR